LYDAEVNRSGRGAGGVLRDVFVVVFCLSFVSLFLMGLSAKDVSMPNFPAYILGVIRIIWCLMGCLLMRVSGWSACFILI